VTFGESAAVPYPELPGGDLPVSRTSVRTWCSLTVSSLALTAAVVVGTWATTQHSGAAPTTACVVVRAGSPGGELHAIRSPCSTDPSFTVAKRADAANRCSPGRYAQLLPPFADQATGRLCLVPNLVVGHCYRFGVPVGMWELGRCAGAATIKVTRRVDADDSHACRGDAPAVPDLAQPVAQPRALTYPSRTYCFSDVPDK
jgi:hypothetical protein